MTKRLCMAVAILLSLCCEVPPTEPGSPPFPSHLQIRFSGDTSGTAYRNLSSGNDAQNFCRVTAEWTPSVEDDFMMYVLYRSESSGIAEGGPGVTGIASIPSGDSVLVNDDDVQWATRYHYALLTMDSEGMGAWSNEDSIDTPDISPTPSVLHLDSVVIDRATISWTRCPDDDFASYRVFRSDLPGIEDDPDYAASLAIFDDASDTTMVDSSFAWGTSYYSVRTENSQLVYSWSNEIAVTTLPPAYPWRIVRNLPWEGYVGSVAMTWDGSTVFVTNESLFLVARSGVPPLNLLTESTFPIPTSVCISPDDASLFVTCSIMGTLEVYKTSIFFSLGSLYFGGGPSCSASALYGEHVYCGCLQSGSIYAVRSSDLEVTGNIHIGGGPAGMVCSPEGDRLFVSLKYDDRLQALACPSLEPLFTVDVGDGPGPISVSVDGDRLYVACQAEGSVWVLSPDDGSVLHMIEQQGIPAGMVETPDGSVLYISDAGAGKITALDTDDWSQLITIETSGGAGELRCSPDGDWLIAAGGSGGNLLVIGK